VSVIAPLARMIACQRAGPRRTTTEPCPDLGDEQRQSAGQWPGTLHLGHRLGESCRPGARVSGTHRVARAEAAIHPGAGSPTAGDSQGHCCRARRRPLPRRSADAFSVRAPRLEGISRLALLSASGHSTEGR